MKSIRKNRALIPIFIVVFAAILVIAVSILIYTLSGNYINYTNIDDSSEKVTSNTAKDSNIIIMNGIVLGASKNGAWVSADKFYSENSAAKELEVYLYSGDSIYGTYKTASLKRHIDGVTYTTLDKSVLPGEYVAISTNVPKRDTNLTKYEPTKQDESYVKQALGGYKLLKSSVEVVEAYTVNIKENDDKIICATAKKANLFGVYSAVIYVTNGKASLVKYSYVRDTKNSDRWPVYSLKAVKDLNGAGLPELILEELTGNDVRYTVLEIRNDNKFYQVLNVNIEI